MNRININKIELMKLEIENLKSQIKDLELKALLVLSPLTIFIPFLEIRFKEILIFPIVLFMIMVGIFFVLLANFPFIIKYKQNNLSYTNHYKYYSDLLQDYKYITYFKNRHMNYAYVILGIVYFLLFMIMFNVNLDNIMWYMILLSVFVVIYLILEGKKNN